jgi:hypothetical protein
MYGRALGDSGRFAVARGLTAAGIRALGQCFEAALLPEEGSWDEGAGRETPVQAQDRCGIPRHPAPLRSLRRLCELRPRRPPGRSVSHGGCARRARARKRSQRRAARRGSPWWWWWRTAT